MSHTLTSEKKNFLLFFDKSRGNLWWHFLHYLQTDRVNTQSTGPHLVMEASYFNQDGYEVSMNQINRKGNLTHNKDSRYQIFLLAFYPGARQDLVVQISSTFSTLAQNQTSFQYYNKINVNKLSTLAIDLRLWLTRNLLLIIILV